MQPLVSALLLVICLGGWRMGRRATPETLGLLCLALFWHLMSCVGLRFLEYSIPLLLLAAGFLARDALARQPAPWPRAVRRALLASLFVVLALGHCHAVRYLVREVAPKPPPRFRGAAAWMEKNIPAGETVLNIFWDEFPELFYDGQRQNFVWGLDPTYTIRHNPAQADLLERSRKDPQVFNAALLSKVFQTRYLITSRQRVYRLGTLAQNGKILYWDKYAAIFELK